MTRHLLVTNDFPPKVGGIQAYIWDLWGRLDPESFVVLTASSHPEHATFDATQRAAAFDIRRAPGRILYFPTPANLRRVRSLAHEVGASLVMVDPALPLGLLGPHLGVPYGVVLHGAEVVIPARMPVGRRLVEHVVSRAALVVAAGNYVADEARRALRGAPLPPLVVLPPGVDGAAVRPLGPVARTRARAELGLPTEGPLVVSLSRLVPRKGMDVLVRAAARLVPSFPGLVVAIAGAGRDEPRLARLIAAERAPVRLLGRLSEPAKAALLGAGDVFALPCRNRWLGLEQEGFGIVFLEAAAAGIPQVAGRSGGVAEAVDDGVTGLVVPRPEDPGSVALALRRLLVDGDLRRRMGAAGRARVLDSFSRDGLAAKLAGALAEVAG
ncbi:MAG TPA: glycosyltransferase family 4 protein [Acidimicrobiales bacterium]